MRWPIDEAGSVGESPAPLQLANLFEGWSFSGPGALSLRLRRVAKNVGNPASAGLFHSETSRVDPNIGAVVYGRLDGALAFRLLRALISRIFSATDYQKKVNFVSKS